MENIVNKAGSETYDRIFKALGDPHRIEIMELLREKELSAGEILAAIDVVQSTLSHHMKTLVEAGAVNALRHGKWTYYSLNQENLAQTAAFLQDCAKGTRKLTESASKSRQAEDASDAGASGKQSAHRDSDAKEAGNKGTALQDTSKYREEKSSGDDALKAARSKASETEANVQEEKSEKKKSKKNKKNKKNKK